MTEQEEILAELMISRAHTTMIRQVLSTLIATVADQQSDPDEYVSAIIASLQNVKDAAAGRDELSRKVFFSVIEFLSDLEGEALEQLRT